MKYIELVEGMCIEELLHNLYIEEGKSIREIADRLNVHYHTVNNWLKQAGIVVRKKKKKLLELIEVKSKLKENE